MKKSLFLLTFLFLAKQSNSQNSEILGQYHLAKTRSTPENWQSFNGSATVIRNSDGSLNITGEFLIRTNETTSLKASFNARNCEMPSNNEARAYSASGDVYVTRGAENGGDRHYNISKIVVNFKTQEIRISETESIRI